MITVRNTDTARALTVRASEAMEVGMVVAVIQGTAVGKPCSVRKATVADLDDPTVMKGIVDFVVDSDEAVDFDVDVTDMSLTQHTGAYAAHLIPSGAQCVVWYDKPIIGFYKTAVGPTLGAAFASTREGAKVASLASAAKIEVYSSAATDGRENYLGFVYRNEGPELTVLFTNL